MFRAAGALVFVVALAPAAQAEDITFADAVAHVDRTPQTQAGEAELASARSARDAAGAWSPTSIHGGTNRLTARVVVGIALPLPILGTRGAARREADARARVVRAEIAGARRLLQRDIALAWLGLAHADAEAAALAIAVTQTEELERLARGRVAAGAGAEVDVITAQAARARAAVDAAAAAHEQRAASAELAALIGTDARRELHAGGPLPTGTLSLDAVRAQLASHSDRVTAVERIAQDEASEHVIRTERRPGITLDAEASLRDPTTPGTDAFVGITLELPILAGFSDKLRAARSHTRADRFVLQATDAKLGGELVAAFERWQAASERLASLEHDVLPLQERSTELAGRAYREGARDLSTALQATRDLTALRAELATARIASSVAWVELLVASGKGLDAP